MTTLTVNGNVYNSETSFAEFTYVTQILALASDIMVETDARTSALSTWTFSTTTTDADPGDGFLRFDQATQNTTAMIYADLLDVYGTTLTDLLDALDESTSTVKGWLLIRQRNDRTKWLMFRLTAVTTASGYRKLTVSWIAGSAASPFADGALVSMHFAQTGDKGDTGSLAGGTLSGTLDADGNDITDIDLLSATTAMITTATIDDATAETSTVSTLLTLSGGSQTKALYLGDVSGDVVIAATDPFEIHATITGDTVFLVAGGTLPGYGHPHLFHITMGGAGGYAVDVLPVNLLTYSEQFDNAAWTKTNATISANAVAAPDGRTTADKLVEESGTVTPQVEQTYSKATSSIAVVGTIFLKSSERTVARFWLYGASSVNRAVTTVDLSTGTLSGTAALGTFSGVSATIAALESDWYRVDLVATTDTSAALTFLVIAGSAPYSGDGASGLYLWGAQLVAGPSPLGYAAVGATRSGQVVWQGAEIDFPSLATNDEVDMAVGYEASGRIVLQDHTVESL